MQAEAAAAFADDPCFRYCSIRDRTVELCRPLEVEDYQVQSAPEVSPPKWHLAHVTWFFETFVLRPHVADYRSPDDRYERLFNSYYQGVGAAHPRLERHVLSRPTLAQVMQYRSHVDEHIGKLVAAGIDCDLAQRIELGLQHEQQHQELILMDVKRNFLANPLHPAYHRRTTPPSAPPQPMRWLEHAGGVAAIGQEGPGFAFDNEQPRHRVFLEDYRIASRPVTNAEYLEFMQAGGYAQPALWLSDGWSTVQERRWRAPLYWLEVDGEWHEMTLAGVRPLDRNAPLCHVSCYEADAYARWCGVRLPTEAEWETAAARRAPTGNFADAGVLQPLPARRGDEQWFGDVWEWTSSAYSPYPGYKPWAGALGEYNGKFMANQHVLRGGSCLTPQSHARLTYRNFFYPHDRWSCTGIRLAADA